MDIIDQHKYQRLDREIMSQVMISQNALTIHQLTIPDFLNSISSVKDLMKIVKDDPGLRGTGYGIGEVVASRILEKRNSMGGFKTVEDLLGIDSFGLDKFNDFVYTYVTEYVPLTSSLGVEFDELILALSKMELYAKKNRWGLRKFIEQVYLVLQVDKNDYNYDINEVFQEDSDPSFILNNAQQIAILRKYHRLKIGNTETHFEHLITTFLASVRNLSLAKAAVHSRLGLASYLYFDDDIIETKVDVKHFNVMSLAHYHGFADALAMEYNNEMSFVWNILKYYTNEDSPIKKKFDEAANKIGLGYYHNGWNRFYNDGEELRSNWISRIKTSSRRIESKLGDQILSNSALRTASEVFTLDSVAQKNADIFLDVMAALVQTQEDNSDLIVWNRLEPRTRTDDFSRPMYAEIRDPLWMIARQYQFGEFLGEDAGSAIECRTKIKTSSINKYKGANSASSDYNDEMPLERLVEATNVDIDMMSRLEMSRWWKKKLSANQYASLVREPEFKINHESWNIKADHLELIDDANDYNQLLSNEQNQLNTSLLNTQQFDGFKFFQSIENGSATSLGLSSTILNLLGDFQAWVIKNYIPNYSPSQNAWKESRLEYAFQAAAPNADKANQVLKVDEFANGHLDWYYFQKESLSEQNSDLVSSILDLSQTETHHRTMIPVQMSIPGLPLPRWWQIEDYKINFEKLTINRSDTSTLAFTEFVTQFSNDWLLVPFNLNAGSLAEVDSLIVKDVFGQSTIVKTANHNYDSNTDDWNIWSMFDISSYNGEMNNCIFLPPSLVKSLESKPFEEVQLVRDEMSNVVWAVETKISDQMLDSKDGFEGSTERKYSKAELEAQDTVATIRYRIGNEVPDNWIPFIPVKVENDVLEFRRGVMVKPRPDGGYHKLRPWTSLIRVNRENEDKKFTIYHEEVPKTGTCVKRTWQRARWYDGKVYWWASNRKTAGKGQGYSGLKWDLIENI